MNDSVLLLIKPTFAPYWGGQGPPLAPFFVAPMDICLVETSKWKENGQPDAVNIQRR